MTRKHFIYIALELRAVRPLDNDLSPNADAWRAQWNFDVNAMADVCRHFNPQFKRERFLAACGGLYGRIQEDKAA